MELQNGGMEMINGGNLYRSDRVSDEYLLVNNCGYQATGSVDTTTVRPRGRSDYLLLYVWHGRLVLREGGEEISAPDFSSQYPSVDDYLQRHPNPATPYPTREIASLLCNGLWGVITTCQSEGLPQTALRMRVHAVYRAILSSALFRS